MNRSGEKRVGARQEKSPLFTKITREMNQLNIDEQIIAIYIWESMEVHIYFYILRKSCFLDHEHSTMIQTLCNFSPPMMFEFGSIHLCLLLSLEKSICKFSMVYKNECSDMA